MILVLIVSLIISWLLLYFSVKKNLEMLGKLDEVEIKTSTALDILDAQYENIDKQLKIEVFSDEPAVKQLIQDIKIARDSVLLVSRVLNGDEDIVEDV